MPQYSVDNLTVDHILGYIKDKSIAIPEMQRPFVWKGDKIRDLIDSLYNGFPIGYLIIWQNPDTVDKNGEKTLGKKIMIDGQQRVTALMTSIVGCPVLDKDFKEKVYRIAFNPYAATKGEPCFEVQSAAIVKDKKWIEDISVLFKNDFDAFSFILEFCKENTDMEPQKLNKLLEKVRNIRNAPIGVINLNKELSLDSVTEIFIRINSKGVSLSQSDFVMSTLAADEKYGGNILRKAIDYFCHLLTTPNFIKVIENDETFKASQYYPLITWAAKVGSQLFEMPFENVLRIAFMSQYYRGKMANLTDLLHGRNFDTRSYEEEIMKNSSEGLIQGVCDVFNRYNYDQFNDCLKGAGFISTHLIGGRMAIVFAYTLFLRLRKEPTVDMMRIHSYVRKWYVMSVLTGRYASSPETMMDTDLRGIREKGFFAYYDDVMANLSDTFWDVTIVQKLETSSTTAPAFMVFLAAQCKNNENSFLSDGSKIRDLLVTADRHHIFPQQYLKDNGKDDSVTYNQVANYTYLSRPINIAVGKKSPKDYLGEIVSSINSGTESKYTTINTMGQLRANLRENCIPEEVINMKVHDYESFLEKRRKLMARKIRDYFYSL